MTSIVERLETLGEHVSAPAPGARVTPTGVLLGRWPTHSEEWYAARRAGIGSSDIPAIVGSSNYATKMHVWLDKRGELPAEDLAEAATWGTLLEDVVAAEWARREGLHVAEVGTLAHAEHPWRRANLDRLVHGCAERTDGRPICGVEVKTRNAFTGGVWRHDVPDDVLAQTLWQLHVTGLDHMHVACLIGGQRLVSHVVTPDPDVTAFIVEAAAEVWQAVLDGVMPAMDPTGLLIGLLDALHPDRAGTRVVSRAAAARIGADYALACSVAKNAEDAKDAAKAEMVALLADAHTAVDADGKVLATYKPTLRASCDLEALAENYPDAHAACVTRKATRPVLRFTKGLL